MWETVLQGWNGFYLVHRNLACMAGMDVVQSQMREPGVQGLKRSVEEDMESYHKEQSLQEYEHFRGDTEEAKVPAPVPRPCSACTALCLWG